MALVAIILQLQNILPIATKCCNCNKVYVAKDKFMYTDLIKQSINKVQQSYKSIIPASERLVEVDILELSEFTYTNGIGMDTSALD